MYGESSEEEERRKRNSTDDESELCFDDAEVTNIGASNGPRWKPKVLDRGVQWKHEGEMWPVLGEGIRGDEEIYGDGDDDN